jgi:hypothetical protein
MTNSEFSLGTKKKQPVKSVDRTKEGGPPGDSSEQSRTNYE